ncbi:unnamed protein product [Peniophora sp. CBMAI 1063]|nr:unnamed protein product [Peniophora sp. CBMAI 1063]
MSTQGCDIIRRFRLSGIRHGEYSVDSMQLARISGRRFALPCAALTFGAFGLGHALSTIGRSTFARLSGCYAQFRYSPRSTRLYVPRRVASTCSSDGAGIDVGLTQARRAPRRGAHSVRCAVLDGQVKRLCVRVWPHSSLSAVRGAANVAKDVLRDVYAGGVLKRRAQFKYLIEPTSRIPSPGPDARGPPRRSFLKHQCTFDRGSRMDVYAAVHSSLQCWYSYTCLRADVPRKKQAKQDTRTGVLRIMTATSSRARLLNRVGPRRPSFDYVTRRWVLDLVHENGARRRPSGTWRLRSTRLWHASHQRATLPHGSTRPWTSLDTRSNAFCFFAPSVFQLDAVYNLVCVDLPSVPRAAEASP